MGKKRRYYTDHADINTAVNSLNLTIVSAIDECVHLRILSLKNPPKPWMTDELKSEVKYRNKLRNYYCKFGSVIENTKK